jgi:hypothetical protein
MESFSDSRQSRLEERRMLIRSGRVLTAVAALSHMHMALWLIRQASPSLAARIARYLVVDSRPSQSAYAMSDHLAHTDPHSCRNLNAGSRSHC